MKAAGDEIHSFFIWKGIKMLCKIVFVLHSYTCRLVEIFTPNESHGVCGEFLSYF